MSQWAEHKHEGRVKPHSNKMKVLRAAARAQSKGLPAVSYGYDQKCVKMYALKDGTEARLSRTCTLMPSTKHLYRLLKKEYRRQQRAGAR